MKGQIISFSPQRGQGVIMGEEGTNHPFTSEQWRYPTAPMIGDMVEFVIDSQGNVVGIENIAATPTSNLNLTKSPELTSTTSSLELDKPIGINPYQAPQSVGYNNPLANQNGINPVWAEEENYGFFDWVKKCLRNYTNFNGRARRKEYWYFYLFFMLIYILGVAVDSMLDFHGILAAIISLALLLPNLAVSARRLHDINKSGWWMFITLIPIIGSIIYIIWLATDTKPETNKWGSPARRLP